MGFINPNAKHVLSSTSYLDHGEMRNVVDQFSNKLLDFTDEP